MINFIYISELSRYQTRESIDLLVTKDENVTTLGVKSIPELAMSEEFNRALERVFRFGENFDACMELAKKIGRSDAFKTAVSWVKAQDAADKTVNLIFNDDFDEENGKRQLLMTLFEEG